MLPAHRLLFMFDLYDKPVDFWRGLRMLTASVNLWVFEFGVALAATYASRFSERSIR